MQSRPLARARRDERMKCPVTLPVQAWIETSLLWFGTEFGPRVVTRDVVLPSAFVPRSYTATTDQIRALVNRVCTVMDVPPRRIKLDIFDGAREKQQARLSGRARAVGHFREEAGQAIVALDLSEAADPACLTAIIAHELCHVRLLGERRISARRRPDHERLTDLLTVFLGFGIFSANAALRYSTTARTWSAMPRGDLDERTLNASRNDGYSRLGYLSEREFGYALACYCTLRGEHDPTWRHELDLGPRGYLDQGLSYLGAGDGPTLPTERLINETFTTAGNGTIQVVFEPNHSAPLGPILASASASGLRGH